VLARSEPIPAEAVVACARLDKALADKVEESLLSFYAKRKEHQERFASSAYIGFIPPDPSILTQLRAVYQRVVPEAGRAAAGR
jgi:ABC-type phosphate/phosphonate transport system substrate-binding protein